MSGPPEYEPPEEERETGEEDVAPEMDEDALRRLLQESVRDLEPRPDALDHLHRAVPARRARRRQALVGVAAAVVVGGAAIPALLHVDIVPGGDNKPMHAASHEGATQQKEGDKGEKGGGKEKNEAGKGKKDGGKGAGGSHATSPGTGGHSSGPDPSGTLGAMSPTCTRVQLGKGVTQNGAADAQGRVYGSFQVVNISDTACTIEDDGIVGATAMGGARSDAIQVLDHTTGDAATNLPDPSLAPDEVVLKPGTAYAVKFAWIPRAGGGTSGCSTSSTPPPDGTDGGQEGGDSQLTTNSAGGTSEGGDADAGTTGGATGGDDGSDPGDGGGTPSKSVVISHTPDVGGPVAEAVLQGACAGTIYRTGALPAS